MAKDAIAECHDAINAGHFGKKKTWKAVRRLFYLHDMGKDVEEYVEQCTIYNGRKHQPEIAVRPFQRMGIDLMEMPLSNAGNRVVIVAIDHYSKWAIAKALPNGSAEEVATYVIESIMMQFGSPEEIWSDYVNQWAQTKQKLTSIYHTNERTNLTNEPDTM